MPLYAKNKEDIKPILKQPIKQVQPIEDEYDSNDDELDMEDEKITNIKETADIEEDLGVPIPEYPSIEEKKLRLMNLLLRKMEIDEQLKNKRIIEKTDQTQMGLKTEYMIKMERNNVLFIAKTLAQELFDSGVSEKEINDIEKKPWMD